MYTKKSVGFGGGDCGRCGSFKLLFLDRIIAFIKTILIVAQCHT